MSSNRPFTPSPQQQAFFDWIVKERGNAVLKAVAGAGKTTTLLKGVELMQGNVFVGVYNKKMAEELKGRITDPKRVRASTFHSAGSSTLRFAFKDKKLEVDDKKVLKTIEAFISESGRIVELEPLSACVADVVSMAKQRGIGPLQDMDDNDVWLDMIRHYDLLEHLPEEYEGRTDKVIPFARAILKRSNENLNYIDFDDMVYLPLVYKRKPFQQDWVLIDEAQDTNPTRRALAKAMLKPNGRLVAVGDPHQAIFGFTGADNDSLDQITAEFRCKELPLTVTYRCPKDVVAHAKQWVNHIEAHESAPEGEVAVIDYKDLQKHLEAGDAILCRYNKYLVNLCFKLIKAGIPARIEGRAIGDGLVKLASKWKGRNLDAIRHKVEDFMNREVERALEAKKEQTADHIIDRCETLLVLIDRAEEQGITTVSGLKEMIASMFAETSEIRKDMVTLCSVHRSKGLEWKRVFLLGREELMPSPMAKQPWQVEQEINLIYVGVTRAMDKLYEVINVREEEGVRRRVA